VKTPEEVAEALVTVEHAEDSYDGDSWRLARVRFGRGEIATFRHERACERAERLAGELRCFVADIIRADREEAVRFALGEPPPRPVSEEWEAEIRRSANMAWASEMKRDTFALLDHARAERDHAYARLALLARDGHLEQYALGHKEGWRAGWREGWAASDGREGAESTSRAAPKEEAP
jgi:hypothetical protein